MKTIFSLICLTAATISLHAQIYQRSDLLSHKWISEDETTLSVSFSAKEMVYQAELRDSSVLKFPVTYYLSATNDSTFDHSLVGKSQSGKYIKTYQKLERSNGDIDHIMIYTINELTNTKLVYTRDDKEYVFYDLPVSQIPRKQNKSAVIDVKKTRMNKQQPLSPGEMEKQTQELIRRANEQIKCKQ